MTRIATLIALAAIAIAAATIPAKPMEGRKLQKLANEARTFAEHKEAARHYEVRARHFEDKAEGHERDADELTLRSGYNPMKHKWPAMVQAPIDKSRAQAMEARRAARESLELAVKHHNMAAKAGGRATE